MKTEVWLAWCLVSAYLVGDLPLRALRGVALVPINEGLHHPLVPEGGEARRLVVQLVHELLGAVGLQLQVCDTFFVKVVSAPLLSSLNVTCDVATQVPGTKTRYVMVRPRVCETAVGGAVS